jgi:hypothetical protein
MKILVGGLLEQQRRHLEAACPPNVTLRFVGSDKEPQTWAPAGRGCDVCIIVTNFCSHKHEETLRSAGCNVVRHSGGIKGLKALIAKLAE